MEKKLRFGDLVRSAGRPQIVTLWTDPKKDRGFMKAAKENRVLTVIQEPGTQKDFGRIGFKRHQHAAYFVFPRPLPPKGCIIGINYQLVEEPAVRDPVSTEDLKRKVRPAKPSPAKKNFFIRVRRTATVETEVNVEAESETGRARGAKGEPFELERAAVREEVVRAE